MREIKIIILLFFMFLAFAKAQENPGNFNFETFEEGNPTTWSMMGTDDYTVSKDSKVFKEGKSSILIESKTDLDSTSFKAVVQSLPNYDGKSITLSGYIKTQGAAADGGELFIRIDPNINYIGMKGTEVTGDTDWKYYAITLPLDPENTESIVLGGLFSGGGKLWFDDFKVTIDGKDISEAKVYKKSYKAQLDTAYDQESAIVFPELSKQKQLDLTLLGKIWGFLKYHHPEIAQGNYNWDYELFRFLPAYLKSRSIVERDALLLQWIDKYGEISLCESCETTRDEAVLKPNLSAVKELIGSVDLKQKLDFIYANRSQGPHYYVKSVLHVGNPEFTNESSYENMTLPDAGYRLLSLFRYWNMIEYYFPYKHLTDTSWTEVLSKHLVKFIEANNRLAYETAALQLIAEVNDTHANLWGGAEEIDNYRGKKFAPIRVGFIENELVVTDIYNPELLADLTIKVGDVITHIEGRPVDVIVDSLKPYFPASNTAAQLRDIENKDLLRSTKERMTIQYRDSENKTQTVLLHLYDEANLKMYHWYKTDESKPSYHKINEDIGYVTLSTIKDEDVVQIKTLFKHTKGMIIDIRNYPSAFMIYALGQYFVSKPTPFATFIAFNHNNPGEFLFGEPAILEPEEQTYSGKVVVLVDANTQSSAEYTAMAFRAGNRTTIIGSQTAGADGNVSRITLPGNLRTLISGIGVYYPDGRETQRIGIVPDIEVKPTIKGIRKQKDEVLERAIQFINEN
ncbi:S41 family peptidase [Flavobacterium sp. NKUCC04_CG]|uniref:S41 family peptidase n=1 Tax=Flavobacterium sp. NKUCC04_CG TaxID=2842121 RepID=UPI001C5BD480|nr:S41 family peptidase [Flavobacterium sp. NKUCC04_CG]MBW3519844.1 peptidase S41 [Flavobacterium sp. NKUCC04_CG]